MKRGTLLIIGLVAAAFATVAAPSDASALDLRIGIQGKGGGALFLPDDGNDSTDDESELGYGYGAQLNVGFNVMPLLYVGAYGQIQESKYTVETEIPFIGRMEADYTLSHPSAGLHLRADLGLAAVQVQGGYVFGEASRDFEDRRFAADVSGFQIGAFAGFTLPLVPGLADLDIGPYVDFTSFKREDADAISQTNLSGGLAIQANFGLPL